ncbi:MAG: hypothetical protein EBT65_01720 [Actinobacteria bacterium]|nr:hypothetical protein [Actinomycetota bacterium]
MSKLQELSKLGSQRTICWVTFGISLTVSFFSCIAWMLNGLALTGCRMFHYSSPESCTTGATDGAGTLTVISGIVAIVSVIMAIVVQTKISELKLKKD